MRYAFGTPGLPVLMRVELFLYFIFRTLIYLIVSYVIILHADVLSSLVYFEKRAFILFASMLMSFIYFSENNIKNTYNDEDIINYISETRPAFIALVLAILAVIASIYIESLWWHRIAP